jgi:hypothetical protein
LRGTLAASALLLALSLATPASAERQFGYCSDRLRLCVGPSASLHLLQWNLTTNKLAAGIVPGAGYGVTWAPDQWYSAGLHLYLSSVVGGGQPGNVTPSIVASFANYLRLGAGAKVAVDGGPARVEWLMLIGIGSDFGGSPRYFREKLGEPGRL